MKYDDVNWKVVAPKGVWRSGSACDSRSEGWEFEFLCPHAEYLSAPKARRTFARCFFACQGNGTLYHDVAGDNAVGHSGA